MVFLTRTRQEQRTSFPTTAELLKNILNVYIYFRNDKYNDMM